MPTWEKFAAHATHWAFYVIMIAAPLTGWLYVSTGWNIENDRPFSVPTVWFGLFQVPHIPGLETLPDAARGSAAESFMEVHELLAFGTLGLFALHVLAALKHHVLDRDDVLTRMLPFLKPLGRTAS
jgi:cytochrome b561